MRLILIFISACLTLCGCGSCNPNQDEEFMKSHPIAITKLVPQYYDRLFDRRIKNKLGLVETEERYKKDTVSDFIYNDEYYIELYKLSNSYNYSLSKSLSENYKEANQEVGEPFYGNQKSLISIWDRVDVTKADTPSSVISIALYGNNPHIIEKNDSVAYYSIELKKLSIKYKERQEFYVEPSDQIHVALPIGVLFIRRNKNLLLVFMSSKKGNELPKALYTSIFK